jgi:hypothetical protein
MKKATRLPSEESQAPVAWNRDEANVDARRTSAGAGVVVEMGVG